MIPSASPGPSGPPLPRALDRARGLLACLAAYLAAGAVAAAVGRLSAGLHPILTAGLADLAATLVVFGFSLAYNNSSFYDPYWSLIPPFLALYWLLAAGARGLPARQALAGGLLLAWAVRLTFNWVRRWRGLSHEDWRYARFRRNRAGYLPDATAAPKHGYLPYLPDATAAPQRGHLPYWTISFAGFHLMPTIIVFLGCLSLWPALTAGRSFGALDLAAALLTAGALALEAAADQQLARFLRTAGPDEVLETGLWSLSRHPNYFGEVAFWWGLWLFGLASEPSAWWTVAGPLCMTALFLGVSVPMMDRHLAARQPGYAAVLKKRSAFMPWFPRK
jgi:steroid 5-alpha reductase family enzyme